MNRFQTITAKIRKFLLSDDTIIVAIGIVILIGIYVLTYRWFHMH